MDIHTDIKASRSAGILSLEAFPDALYEDLRIEVDALATELFALVQADTPSLTGKLRSQERLRFFADKNRITGRVDIAGTGPDAAKAGALEYGAHRPTQVRAHSMRLDHAWGEAFSAPESVMVAAYTRTPDIEALAFESGPLHEMQPEILARLNAVVEKAATAANA